MQKSICAGTDKTGVLESFFDGDGTFSSVFGTDWSGNIPMQFGRTWRMHSDLVAADIADTAAFKLPILQPAGWQSADGRPTPRRAP